MSISLYALLSSDKSSVIGFNLIDTNLFPSMAVAKTQYYRIVNLSTPAQPSFNSLTQSVVQNGWTISSVDVKPVWLIVALTSDQITAATALTNYQATLALNIVAAATSAITNWASLTSAQKDAVALDVVKVIRGILQVQFGVNN